MNQEPFHCRSCGRTDCVEVLDLGSTPLANALLSPDRADEAEPTYPLALVFCPGCSLVQITETVPPEVLFKSYFYFSSFSDTMLRHAEALAGSLTRSRKLGPGSLVVEVASNDGYLLQYYQRLGVPVLGVEPAENVANVARERGVPTLCEFFGSAVGARLRAEGRRADVLHANNVLAHVADLNGFVAGVASALKDDGVAVIECPYVRDMIERVEFDTIYHEHLCYFSLTALKGLFLRHGLGLLDVEHLPSLHGGSLHVTVGPVHGPGVPTPAVEAMLAREAAEGVASDGYYREFGRRVERLKATLTGVLRDLKSAGRTLAAYGASAKGSTLLNTFGIGRDVLDFVADRSTHKQGHLTPGTRLPIVAPEKLAEARPDYVLLLTWNFEDEILAQQRAYREAGGRFIVPLPDVRIV